jgi:hypothetical protein
VDDDSVGRLFDVETGRTTLRLTGFTADCFPTAFSTDGKRLAIIGEEKHASHRGNRRRNGSIQAAGPAERRRALEHELFPRNKATLIYPAFP